MSHVWWYRPIVLAELLTVVGSLQVQDYPEPEKVQGKPKIQSQNENYKKSQGGNTVVEECLLSVPKTQGQFLIP